MPLKRKADHAAYMRRWRAKRAGRPPGPPRPKRPQRPRKPISTAETDAAWIERFLRLRVLPWERQFLEGAFQPDIDLGLLSTARGAGKSCFAAALGCLHFVGPRARDGVDIVCMGSSLQTARTMFNDAVRLLGARESTRFRVTDNTQTALIVEKDTGRRLRCAAANLNLLGQRVVVLGDEVATWPTGIQSRVISAISSGLGKPDAARRAILIGTRGDGRSAWDQLLTRPEQPGIYRQIHSSKVTGKAVDVFDESLWKQACPSLTEPEWASLRAVLLREASRADSDEVERRVFLHYRLNLAITIRNQEPVLSVADWARCERSADDLPPMSGPCCWGVDLAENAAQSAVAGFFPETGRLEVISAFPRRPNLRTRSKRDSFDYFELYQRGELLLMGNRTVPVADLFAEALERWGEPAVIGCDFFRKGRLQEALEGGGMDPVVTFRRMGWGDGSEDLGDFRRAALEGKFQTPISKMLRGALADAVTVADHAGSEKPGKNSENGRRLRARDDSLAACILAVAVGLRMELTPPEPSRMVIAGGANW